MREVFGDLLIPLVGLAVRCRPLELFSGSVDTYLLFVIHSLVVFAARFGVYL